MQNLLAKECFTLGSSAKPMIDASQLIWISPVISQSELEGLVHWLDQHLKEAGLPAFSSLSRVKTSFCSDPEEALILKFDLPGAEDSHSI
jgi:hypothetical protein